MGKEGQKPPIRGSGGHTTRRCPDVGISTVATTQRFVLVLTGLEHSGELSIAISLVTGFRYTPDGRGAKVSLFDRQIQQVKGT